MLSLNRLINLKTPKLPKGLCKRLRVLRHEIRAGRWTMVHLVIVHWHRSKLTTQIDVDDYILVAEVRGDITVCAGEVG